MAEPNNQTKITGVIHAKFSRTNQGKKDPTQFYTYTSIVLETDHPMKKSKTFPHFELGSKGIGVDDFDVGDFVEITYYMEGEEATWLDKEGNKVVKWVNRAKAMYIRHANLTTDDSKSVGNYTPREKRRIEKAEKDMAIPVMDDDDNDNLPF
jgi:hypothetical protein